jgi:hypothetical protein
MGGASACSDASCVIISSGTIPDINERTCPNFMTAPFMSPIVRRTSSAVRITNCSRFRVRPSPHDA